MIIIPILLLRRNATGRVSILVPTVICRLPRLNWIIELHSTGLHKYKYSNTDKQIQIQKYRYKNTDTKIQIHKYRYTNINAIVVNIVKNSKVAKIAKVLGKLFFS